MKRIFSVFVAIGILFSAFGVNAAEIVDITPSKYDDGSVARVLDNGTAVSMTAGKNVAYNIYFDAAPTKITLSLGTSTAFGGVFEVRLDSPSGELLGSVDTKPLAPASWARMDYVIENTLKFQGKHTLWICAKGGTHDLQGIRLSIPSADDVYYVFTDADYFGDIKDEALRNELNLLYELGALAPIDGNFNGRRIAVTKDLVRAVGSLYKDFNFENGEALFANVTPESEDYPFYAPLCYMGYINADPSVEFDTTEAVNLETAVKWMLKLLNIESAVTGKKTPMDVARDFKLLGGIKAGANDKITRMELATLLVNAIDSKHYVVSSISVRDNKITYSKEPEPLISIGSIYEGEGVLSATSTGNLYSASDSTSSDKVVIDNQFYLFGSTSAPEYLGFKCRFFYTDNNGVKTLIAIRPSSDTEYKLLSTRDTEFETISDSGMEYFVSDTKKETAKLNGKTVVMFNGRPAGDTISNLVDEASYQGKILLINNDGDKTYDVVMIDSAQTILFGGVSADGIYDNLKKENIIIEDMDSVKVLKGNSPISIEDIPIDSVVDLYLSNNATGDKVILMNVSEETVEGIVTARVDDKTVIDDSIEVPKHPDATEEAALGQRTVLALNGYGKYVKVLEAEKAKAAIFLGGGKIGSSSALSAKAGVRILTEESKIEVFECAPNVYFDGYLVKNVNTLCEGLAGSFLGLDNIPDESLIRYRLNSQGKINMIDTKEAGKGGTDDTLTELMSKADQRYVYSNFIKDTAELKDVVPLADDFITAHLWANGNEELYTFTKGIATGSGNKELSAYTTKPDSFVADIVVWSSQKGGDSTSAFLYSRSFNKLGSDGEAVRVICGYDKSGYKEYEVDNYAYTNDDAFRNIIDSIDEGDIITFKMNSHKRVFGNVEYIMHSDMAQTDSDGYTAVMYDRNQSPARQDKYGLMFSGEVVAREGNFAKVEKTQGDNVLYEYVDLRYVRTVSCFTENGRTIFTDKESGVYAAEGMKVAVFSTPYYYDMNFMVIYN